MATHYRSLSSDQLYLMPVDPRDWLAKGHLAYKVLDAVKLMDLCEFSNHGTETRGAPGFRPEMILCLYLYAMCKGVASSRAIARLCLDDIGARFLCGGLAPRYRAIAAFRHDRDQALAGLLKRTVQLCEEAGLVDITQTFVDGTKLKAHASLQKNVRYADAVQRSAKLEARIAQMLARMDTADAQEDEGSHDSDAQEDADDDGDHPIKPGAEREAMVERRERLLAAKERLEAQAQAKHAEHLAAPASERTHHKAPTGVPEPDDRSNLTDPDSAIMTTRSKEYIQGFNGQIVVERAHNVIVGAFLTNACNDYRELIPSFQAVRETCGRNPGLVVADAGYFSAANIQAARKADIPVLIPPKKVDRRKDIALSEALSDDDLNRMSAADRMQAILATKAGRETYMRRQCTVETVFGLLKGCPGRTGFRQFLRRGLTQCGRDWQFTCAVHNLKAYFGRNAQAQRPPKQKNPNEKGLQYRLAVI